jgi:hypothetical protein
MSHLLQDKTKQIKTHYSSDDCTIKNAAGKKGDRETTDQLISRKTSIRQVYRKKPGKHWLKVN